MHLTIQDGASLSGRHGLDHGTAGHYRWRGLEGAGQQESLPPRRWELSGLGEGMGFGVISFSKDTRISGNLGNSLGHFLFQTRKTKTGGWFPGLSPVWELEREGPSSTSKHLKRPSSCAQKSQEHCWPPKVEHKD